MRKKLILTLLAIFWSGLQLVQAQSFFQYGKDGEFTFHLGAGIAKYFGEMSEDRKLGDLNPHVSLGLTIPFKPKLSFRPEISFYQISAADSDLPPDDFRRRRNLSFKSTNWEISVLAIYGLHKRDARTTVSWKPYVGTGVGLTFFNPKAQLDGVWYELQPLFTEGIDYDRFDVVIPMVGGVSYKVNPELQLALEISYRFTFTDYLDDVSMDYRNPLSFSDPIAAALADRRPEVGLEKAAAGTPRGNDSNNDGYLFLGLKAFYKLPGKGPLRRKR